MKIDFFEQFGNSRELFRIRDMYEFFKCGEAKSIKKDLIKDDTLRSIISKYTSSKRKDGSDAASYTFHTSDALLACMVECEEWIKSLNLPDIDMKVKIQNCLDVLGYVDIATGREEDRRRLLITECSPLIDKKTGKPWAYRLSTRSLGSGKTARISVYAWRYEQNPVVAGDVVYGNTLSKNNAGYWYLMDYKIE